MNNKINQYVNNLFDQFESTKNVLELKNDLLLDLNEKYKDLIQQGSTEEAATLETIKSIGTSKEIEETINEIEGIKRTSKKDIPMSFKASALEDFDFTNVHYHKGDFSCSAMQKTDFSNADLSGSIFKASDLQEANFNKTNLSDCNFSVSNLKNASFDGSILNNTTFSKSYLEGINFKNIKFINVDFSMVDFTNTTFENCVFNNCSFDCSNLNDLSFEGQTIIDIHFEKVALQNTSFKKSTLKNVSFKPPISITNKYYKVIKTILFDEATMDKLTYNSLKSLGANVDNVCVI